MIKGIPMKKLLWMAAASLFVFSGAHAKTVDRIVAQVNDEIITLSELKRETAQYLQELKTKYTGEQYEQMAQKVEQQVLDTLIQDKLLYQKAMEMGFNANVDNKVSSMVQQTIKENNLKDTDELEKALEDSGRTMKDYREEIKRSIVIHELVNEFVDSRIAMLTPEIDKYYKDHAAEFTTPEEVTLSEIIITGDGNLKDAENRANELYQRLQQGESFAALASQYSKGSTANKGGSIGAYLISKLNADAAKAIEGLKDGEISKPQKIKDGMIIYRVDARKTASTLPLDQVKDEIKNRIYQRKRGPEFERYINALKEDAYIQIYSEIK
jgi:peptidyl-prolyl cis-trans isomerase SurA